MTFEEFKWYCLTHPNPIFVYNAGSYKSLSIYAPVQKVRIADVGEGIGLFFENGSVTVDLNCIIEEDRIESRKKGFIIYDFKHEFLGNIFWPYK